MSLELPTQYVQIPGRPPRRVVDLRSPARRAGSGGPSITVNAADFNFPLRVTIESGNVVVAPGLGVAYKRGDVNCDTSVTAVALGLYDDQNISMAGASLGPVDGGDKWVYCIYTHSTVAGSQGYWGRILYGNINAEGVLTSAQMPVPIAYIGSDSTIYQYAFGHIQAEDARRGHIEIFSGALVDIPRFFTLCNGDYSSPDLRTKFVVCANSSAGDYDVGDTGGYATHGGASNDHDDHSIPYKAILASQDGAQFVGHGLDIDYEGDPPATGNVTLAHSETDNRPPFYALAYIMRL